jgi:hypothetical protein
VPKAPRQPFTIPLADGPVSPAADRTVAVVIAAVAVVAVVALAGVEPDPRGFDTHVQLGMTACGWPMHYGMPCPTCGCTTAACLVVHGRWIDAVLTQPFGAVLAGTGIWLGGHAAYCLLRSRSFVDLLVRVPLWKVTFYGVVLLLAAWGYKCLTFAPA